ncbi:MAG: anaerobic ribonucleoside-triphosphate reductase activating protein [Arcobacter sp.]|nr:anaerobic ribonucleoside-triphosphate reductase activating protein [Arcobacter sp.]
MKKIIYNLTKFTTLDFKDHLSCVVWFVSCNMRCLYCYNPDIVLSKQGNYTLEDLYIFLKKRVGLLDAVVLSGGEATIFELVSICNTIKELGFKIKLDTNGSNSKLIEELLNKKLIDYVALDFKAPNYKYKNITNSNFYNEFLKSLNLLNKNICEYEVRTTLHNDLLDVDDINNMQDVLIENGYKNNFYIQKFLEVENLSNLETSKNIFDFSKLADKLNIVIRN